MKLTGSAKLNLLLERTGIHDYEDVVRHLPRRYESFEPTPREQLIYMQDKTRVVVSGTIVGRVELLRFQNISNVRFYLLSDFDLEFQIIAWNRPYLKTQLVTGERYTVQAIYDKKRHSLNMVSIKKGDIPIEERIQPVYSLPKDYPPHLFQTLVKKSLEKTKGQIKDITPSYFKDKYKLVSKEEAYAYCHFPKSVSEVREGMRTLKYEEALLFTLRNLIYKEKNRHYVHSRTRSFSRSKLTEFVYSLPFSLTQSQNKACREIVLDMEKEQLMNRLLQGDVGTGKTLVAGIAMYVAFLRGQQSSLMAPTDSLAKQHFRFFQSLFEKTGINVVLLVGSLDSKQRKETLRKISSGEANVIVGTHALFSKDVDYFDLGLAVIDEQHKFGVYQRSLLASKGNDADLLLMSATPIPRTLSMTLYGDLDVSTLVDFPSGKRNVESLLLSPKSKKVFSLIKEALSAHKQVFVVAPQIEESENDFSSVKTVFETISEEFPDQAVLLHGKLNEEEKEKALGEFLSKGKPIIVATSVIEVGIDVKDASLMVVYDAHHFSLSSLHQLRGRIGRDGGKAIFAMVSDSEGEENDKLSVILQSEDGFEIAEADLKLRGPGTLAGIRQSGFPDFQFVNLVNDFKIFEVARQDASYVLEHKDDEEFQALIEAVLSSKEPALGS